MANRVTDDTAGAAGSPARPDAAATPPEPGGAVAAAPTPVQRRGMTYAILTQCFYAISWLALTNGVVLLYFKKIGLPDARILLYLALPSLGDALCRIPLAYLGDRVGKLKVGRVGTVLILVGFAVLAAAPWLPAGQVELAIVAGLLIYAVGNAMMASVWFALLSPIVPQTMRGRFFGRLRLSWQLVSIGFLTGCAVVLSADAPVSRFQLVMWTATGLLVLRILTYLPIPELERPQGPQGSLRQVVGRVLQTNGYASFCAYIFLLMLFTGGCPALFWLILKTELAYGDNEVVWVSILLLVGAVVGFYLGGKLVDQWGTKPVFLTCHVGFAAVLLLFVGRGMLWAGLIPMLVMAASFLFGLVRASSSIAISTEMLALVPSENKSVSTSLATTLQHWGMALSGIFSAWAVDLGVLREHWTLRGQTLTQYDTILLAFAVMILLMVVTLGLVPSVLGKSQWAPQA